jgi:hypothetical protein
VWLHQTPSKTFCATKGTLQNEMATYVWNGKNIYKAIIMQWVQDLNRHFFQRRCINDEQIYKRC